MWSLPNIVSMNARAAAQAVKLRRAARRGPGKRQRCEAYGCEQLAAKSELWFDIFSDDPKGIVHTCDDHIAEESGELFECDACHRLMLDHITHERYGVSLDGEKTLCLKCAAEEYFNDPENWIAPRSVKSVVLEPYDPGLNGNNVPLFSAETGVVNLGQCRHVLGVRQPLPNGIRFVDNMEFDSDGGFQISGRKPIELVQSLDEPFCPVLDAAYQFAMSVGIYVRSTRPRR